MIRISTCVIAALVFLGILFALNCAVLVFFGWRISGSIPLVVTSYLLGLLRMRLIANQGRHETEEAEEMRHGATLPQRRYYDDGTWGPD
jgi:hypothetical protein